MTSASVLRLSGSELKDWLAARALAGDARGVPRLVLATIEAGDVPPPRRASDADLIVGIAASNPANSAWSEAADVLVTTAPEAPRPWIFVESRELETVLGRLARRHASQPLAVTALAQVLRVGEHMDFASAVTLESFAYSALLAGPEFRAWRTTTSVKPSHPAPAEPVAVRRAANVLILELARPRRHNALDATMRAALCEGLCIALADASIERVELRGQGASFCSGGDLDEFGSAPDPVTAHAIRLAQSAALLIDQLRPRVEAFVHGSCIGAGIEIAARARRVVARRGAHFRLPELQMGLIPGAGGTASIPRRIGRHRTCFMAISGEDINAETALRWGLIDELADEG